MKTSKERLKEIREHLESGYYFYNPSASSAPFPERDEAFHARLDKALNSIAVPLELSESINAIMLKGINAALFKLRYRNAFRLAALIFDAIGDGADRLRRRACALALKCRV
jgi:hypothetical protein